MNQIYVNGHSIVVKGNKLIIDGKLVDVKLKRGLFGGLGGVSISSSNGSIVNSSIVSGSIISNSSNFSKSSAKIKIGRNTIILKGSKITVNGEVISLNGEKPVSHESLDEELNKNARKYLISTAKENEIEIDGETCRRIIAIEDIIDKKGTVLVKKGEKGGYIANRCNLSEDGTCWIYDDAIVRQDAEIKGSATIWNSVDIYGNATIGGNAQISQQATAHGNVSIAGNVLVSGSADIHGNVSIGGNVRVSDEADIHGNVSIGGNVEISGNADVHGNVSLGGNVKIGGNADIHGNVVLSGDEVITSNRQLNELVGKDSSSSIICRTNGSAIITGSGNVITGSGKGVVIINGRRITNSTEDSIEKE